MVYVLDADTAKLVADLAEAKAYQDKTTELVKKQERLMRSGGFDLLRMLWLAPRVGWRLSRGAARIEYLEEECRKRGLLL